MLVVTSTQIYANVVWTTYNTFRAAIYKLLFVFSLLFFIVNRRNWLRLWFLLYWRNYVLDGNYLIFSLLTIIFVGFDNRGSNLVFWTRNSRKSLTFFPCFFYKLCVFCVALSTKIFILSSCLSLECLIFGLKIVRLGKRTIRSKKYCSDDKYVFIT